MNGKKKNNLFVVLLEVLLVAIIVFSVSIYSTFINNRDFSSVEQDKNYSVMIDEIDIFLSLNQDNLLIMHKMEKDSTVIDNSDIFYKTSNQEKITNSIIDLQTKTKNITEASAKNDLISTDDSIISPQGNAQNITEASAKNDLINNNEDIVESKKNENKKGIFSFFRKKDGNVDNSINSNTKNHIKEDVVESGTNNKGDSTISLQDNAQNITEASAKSDTQNYDENVNDDSVGKINKYTEDKVPLTLLVTDLGGDKDVLAWMMNNLDDDIILGLSPYFDTKLKDMFINTKHDLYINVPIQNNNSNENYGELEIVPTEYEKNVKKIITSISLLNNIKGVYLNNIDSIIEDKKTLHYILNVAYDSKLPVIAERNKALEPFIQQDGTVNAGQYLINTSYFSINDDDILNIDKILHDFEGRAEAKKHYIVLLPPSIHVLNKVKEWLSKQNVFFLIRNTIADVQIEHKTHNDKKKNSKH